jgi:hypothetical protein
MQTRPYQGEIEHFAVHCPETGGVYLIPIAELEVRNQGTLRVTPARNHQQRRVRPAGNYEIAEMVVRPVQS